MNRRPAVVAAVLAALATTAAGQPRTPPATQAAAPELDYASLPPPVQLGVRAETIRRNLPVLPVVVIVESEAAYAEAVSRWNLKSRYPVLLDDGTPAALENIARFVRAFKPVSVFRWDGTTTAPSESAENATPSKVVPWPDDEEARHARIETAVARAWSVLADNGEPPTMDSALKAWKQYQLAPAGVIAARATDGAWTAALALAAGRAQPIVWVDAPAGVETPMTGAQAAALSRSLREQCDRWGLPWKGVGPGFGIDAVTLALNCPAKVQTGSDGFHAITDAVARVEPGGDRWAWAGQIFGSPAEAAYRAMCALYLMPERAWLFDGYPTTDPWNHWDVSKAADALKRAGIETLIDDSPRGGEEHWRARAATPLDAGLVFVNSKGMPEFFELEPGKCPPGDIPLLERPAIVYFIHSYSAARPSDRRTVAGRWLERGTYAYVGSVHEPYLQAFLPSASIAARFVVGAPLGAAVRFDETPGERESTPAIPEAITVLGDPLITMGPPAPRAEGDAPPLPGARNLEETLKAALQAGNFTEAIRTLTLLGRDRDAARLAAAILKEQPSKATTDFAAAAVLPLCRAGMIDEMTRAYALLPVTAASDHALRDALWLAGARRLRGGADERLLGLLRTNIRDQELARDAADLLRPISRLYGREAAAGMLHAARRRATTDEQRDQIDKLLSVVGG